MNAVLTNLESLCQGDDRSQWVAFFREIQANPRHVQLIERGESFNWPIYTPDQMIASLLIGLLQMPLTGREVLEPSLLTPGHVASQLIWHVFDDRRPLREFRVNPNHRELFLRRESMLHAARI